MILQNLDRLTREASQRKTYDYLFELINNDEGMAVIATSDKEINPKFRYAEKKLYKGTKNMDYERKIRKTEDIVHKEK